MTFVEFTWELNLLILAIIEPWDSTPWLSVPNSPTLLLQHRGWQALDVDAILAPAGRIAIEPGKKWIAFESSMGGMDPELVAEVDDVGPDVSSPSLFRNMLLFYDIYP